MNSKFWLKTCKDIGKKVFNEFKKRKPNTKVLKTGFGGDKTLSIDDKAEKIILNYFKSTGKSFIFISEEIGKLTVGKKPEVIITVDPLDGSNNIVVGIPFVTTSIAIGDLSQKMSGVEVGYVKNLINGDDYYAVKNKGAFKNNKRIHITKKRTGCIIGDIAHNRRRNFQRIVRVGENFSMVRLFGSCCLGMCFFAEGMSDAYIGLGGKRTLDHTAAQLIIREAGGIIKDLKGKDFSDYKIDFNIDVNFIATKNKKMYFEIRSYMG